MIILFLIVFLTEIATDLYVPSLPLLAEDFKTLNQTVQWSMSLHLVGFAFGQPLFGYLSDKSGKKKWLVCGFTLFIFSSLACALSSSINAFIFFRLVQGIGASCAPVIALATLKECYPEASQNIKMIALLTLTMSLSPIFAPIIGSSITYLAGWQGNFYLLFIIGIGLLPFLHGPIFDLSKNTHSDQFFSLSACLKLPTFVKSVLINALLVSIVWLFITEAPFILIQTEGLSLSQYSICQAVTVMGYMLGGFVSNRFADKLEPERLIRIGIKIIISSLIALLFLSSINFFGPVLFTLLIALFECGLGIVRPSLINKMMDFSRKQTGMSAGIIGTSEMLMSVLVISFLNFLPTGTLVSLTGLIFVIGSAAIYFYMITFGEKESGEEEADPALDEREFS